MLKSSFLVMFLGLLFLNVVHADSNGVWLLAQDVKGGVFGSDEDYPEFTFVNDTYFGGHVRDLDNPSLYYVDISDLSQFNDLRSNLLTSNSLEINGNSSLNGNLEVSGSTTVTSLETTSIDSTSLNLLASSGDGVFSELESGTGSAVYGYYSGSGLGYSGYFEGGSFRVDSVGDIFLSSSTGDVMSNKFRITSFSNCEEVYADVNGHLGCRITGDIDSSNELQTLSKTGSTISLSDGGSVNLQDDSATNEYPLAGNGISVSTRTVSINAASCGANQYSYWDGNSWECRIDRDTNTQLTEAQVDNYVSDNGYLTTETDPQVGSLTNGKWCTSDGIRVNCNSDVPTGGPYITSVNIRNTCTGYYDEGMTLYLDYSLSDGTSYSKLVADDCWDTWSS